MVLVLGEKYVSKVPPTFPKPFSQKGPKIISDELDFRSRHIHLQKSLIKNEKLFFLRKQFLEHLFRAEKNIFYLLKSIHLSFGKHLLQLCCANLPMFFSTKTNEHDKIIL